jgi:DHA1 family inner membrane transport protein
MTVTFAALTAAPASLAAVIVLFVGWAFFSQLYQAPQQARPVALVPEQRGILLALNASALYLGISLGSLLGSHYLPALGARSLSALALVPLALATATHAASTRRALQPVPTH